MDALFILEIYIDLIFGVGLAPSFLALGVNANDSSAEEGANVLLFRVVR